MMDPLLRLGLVLFASSGGLYYFVKGYRDGSPFLVCIGASGIVAGVFELALFHIFLLDRTAP